MRRLLLLIDVLHLHEDSIVKVLRQRSAYMHICGKEMIVD